MSQDEPTFEQAYARLEQVVRQLEGAPLGLDEAVKLYEEGMASLQKCQRLLAVAEKRISQLTAVTEAGEAETEPFEESTGELHEKVGRRSSATSGKPKTGAKRSTRGKGAGGTGSSGASPEEPGDEGATMDDGEMLF
ncbi:MAG: exodeoxyribonuclease VII small subunit [Planctomycetales bacterium]|nr:exodeoxyribonuclease VII small subunit [Planctomycetales bacterium]